MIADALVGHLVGDYLLQNDWMAANKKKRTWPCVVHCALWTLAVMAFAGAAWWRWDVAAVLFATHLAQDRTAVVAWWMRAAGQRAFGSVLVRTLPRVRREARPVVVHRRGQHVPSGRPVGRRALPGT